MIKKIIAEITIIFLKRRVKMTRCCATKLLGEIIDEVIDEIKK